jgi:hypothetical protein
MAARGLQGRAHCADGILKRVASENAAEKLVGFG